MERLSGLGSRSDQVARSILFGRGTDAYFQALQQAQNATAEDLRAARKWLSDGVYVLNVLPFGYRESDKQAQAAPPPAIGPALPVKFPVIEKATLSNSLRVLLAERHEVPLVNVWLTVDTGSAADPCDLPRVSLHRVSGFHVLRAGNTLITQATQLHIRRKRTGLFSFCLGFFVRISFFLSQFSLLLLHHTVSSSSCCCSPREAALQATPGIFTRSLSTPSSFQR